MKRFIAIFEIIALMLLSVTPIKTIEESKPLILNDFRQVNLLSKDEILTKSRTYLKDTLKDLKPKKSTKEEEIEQKLRPVPVVAHSNFKSYMDYRCITNLGSQQYNVSVISAYTGEYGIRKNGDYFLVAMGSYYANYVGQKYNITFENGMSINIMIGDIKQNKDTSGGQNTVGGDNLDLLEFIVETESMPYQVRLDGSFNCIFTGQVVEILAIE